MARAFALFPFHGGNNPEELLFNANDEIEVESGADTSGWLRGRLIRNGQVGYFPASYVQVVQNGFSQQPQQQQQMPQQQYKQPQFDMTQNYRLQQPKNLAMSAEMRLPSSKSQPLATRSPMQQGGSSMPRLPQLKQHSNYTPLNRDLLSFKSPVSDGFQMALSYSQPIQIPRSESSPRFFSQTPPMKVSQQTQQVVPIQQQRMPMQQTQQMIPVQQTQQMIPVQQTQQMIPIHQTQQNMNIQQTQPMNTSMLKPQQNNAFMQIPQQIEVPKKETRIGYWGSYMAIGCAIAFFLSGIASLIALSSSGETMSPSSSPVLAAVYCLSVSVFIAYNERKWTVWHTGPRPALYGAMAIPGFFWFTTLFASVHLVIVAIVFAVSESKKESFDRFTIRSSSGSSMLPHWLTNIRDELMDLETYPALFLMCFVGINVYIGSYGFSKWTGIVNSLPPELALSSWAPSAKLFGYMLDLNCGLVLLPVCRTFIRYLMDLSTGSQMTSSLLLRAVLQVIPLDKSLEFHKSLAWSILVFAFGHTFFHLVNYSLAPENTILVFGKWPFASGVLIFVVMLLMYGAVSAGVKRFQFEVFWYSHQLFVVFFILLLSHGNGGFNPNVWKWLLGPGAIYIAERIYRYRSAYRTVLVQSVSIMSNVFTIEFSRDRAFPDGYKEGQYLFLNCPHVSSTEWHPFTISSAPQEKSVSVHIRVMPDPMSWTAQVRDYMKVFMAPGKTSAGFITEAQDGKVTGPDGKPLFRIYGPHSAPTQHISAYSVDMIIGAGIGVTPVSATLQSIVHHRWKFSIGKCYPDHAYFFFVCSYKDIESFRWFIRTLKDADDVIHNLFASEPAAMAAKSFEFHLFVTSAPEKSKRKPPVLPSDPEDDEFWGSRPRDRVRQSNEVVAGAPWTELDLLKAIYDAPEEGVRLGSVRVYNGRPHWESRMMEVAYRHRQEKVGVAFCGAPAIASDLKDLVHKFNRNVQNGTTFRLHKENF